MTMDVSRITGLDWPGIEASLDEAGCARTGAVLSPEECGELAGVYGDDGLFRSRVVMAKPGFG